ILSLNGVNTITGNIMLNSKAGVGAVALDPSQFSSAQLYLTGQINDRAYNTVTAPNGVGRLYTLDAGAGGPVATDPNQRERAYLIPVAGQTGTLTINFDTFGLLSPDDLRVYYGPRGTPGSTLLYDSSTNVNYPTVPPTSAGAATITINY